jgi:ligand-binding SRPBCC domain-containing protein
MFSKTYCLERTQFFRKPREEVFEFFADAGNLEAITPPWLNFHIVTPQPIDIAAGTLIDYRLKLFQVPIRWRTRIEAFERPKRFIDKQLSGPYALWHHTHEFASVDAGTQMTDRVDYRIALGPLGRLAHGLFVRRLLDAIFDFRRDKIDEMLGQQSGNELDARSPSLRHSATS